MRLLLEFLQLQAIHRIQYLKDLRLLLEFFTSSSESPILRKVLPGHDHFKHFLLSIISYCVFTGDSIVFCTSSKSQIMLRCTRQWLLWFVYGLFSILKYLKEQPPQAAWNIVTTKQHYTLLQIQFFKG